MIYVIYSFGSASGITSTESFAKMFPKAKAPTSKEQGMRFRGLSLRYVLA